MFGPTIPNPTAGGLLGGTVYEGYGAGRCDCRFTTTYPYAVGPRLGIAYQFASKMVLRVGWGIAYGNTPDGAGPVGRGGLEHPELHFAILREPAATFGQGLVYNPADMFAVNLNPGIRPQPGQINTPPYYLDRNAGRPPRINQWNIALQREITHNIVGRGGLRRQPGACGSSRAVTGT